MTPYLLMGATLSMTTFTSMAAYGWTAWYSGSLWLPFWTARATNTYATLLITTTGDFLPTGAPLARDLAVLPLWLVTTTTALSCAARILVITMATGRAHVHVGTLPAATAQVGREACRAAPRESNDG